jgi:hypothetical protein
MQKSGAQGNKKTNKKAIDPQKKGVSMAFVRIKKITWFDERFKKLSLTR